jgi:hypothetical protein
MGEEDILPQRRKALVVFELVPAVILSVLSLRTSKMRVGFVTSPTEDGVMPELLLDGLAGRPLLSVRPFQLLSEMCEAVRLRIVGQKESL